MDLEKFKTKEDVLILNELQKMQKEYSQKEITKISDQEKEKIIALLDKINQIDELDQSPQKNLFTRIENQINTEDIQKLIDKYSSLKKGMRFNQLMTSAVVDQMSEDEILSVWKKASKRVFKETDFKKYLPSDDFNPLAINYKDCSKIVPIFVDPQKSKNHPLKDYLVKGSFGQFIPRIGIAINQYNNFLELENKPNFNLSERLKHITSEGIMYLDIKSIWHEYIHAMNHDIEIFKSKKINIQNLQKQKRFLIKIINFLLIFFLKPIFTKITRNKRLLDEVNAFNSHDLSRLNMDKKIEYDSLTGKNYDYGIKSMDKIISSFDLISQMRSLGFSHKEISEIIFKKRFGKWNRKNCSFKGLDSRIFFTTFAKKINRDDVPYLVMLHNFKEKLVMAEVQKIFQEELLKANENKDINTIISNHNSSIQFDSNKFDIFSIYPCDTEFSNNINEQNFLQINCVNGIEKYFFVNKRWDTKKNCWIENKKNINAEIIKKYFKEFIKNCIDKENLNHEKIKLMILLIRNINLLKNSILSDLIPLSLIEEILKNSVKYNTEKKIILELKKIYQARKNQSTSPQHQLY